MIEVDLRSDTVTKPGQGMRRAMAEAPVGDDVFGEDPTVRKLEQKAARLLGKPAALFVCSGTMANQICLSALSSPGDEVICDQHAHLYRHEGAAAAVNSGLSFFPLAGRRGVLEPGDVRRAVQPDNVHYPVSRILALENTHNRGNGAVYPLGRIRELTGLAREMNLKAHLDGARMFNACLAGGYRPEELARGFDTVSFCLSKGLGAPVGSMVVASQEIIGKAVRVRKRLGGGWRQAGILAAAGLYALEHNLERLARDHELASRLAQGLAGMAGVSLEASEVQSNIVIFDISPSGLEQGEAISALAAKGVGVVPFGPNKLRAVTHLGVGPDDIGHALDVMESVLGKAA